MGVNEHVDGHQGPVAVVEGDGDGDVHVKAKAQQANRWPSPPDRPSPSLLFLHPRTPPSGPHVLGAPALLSHGLAPVWKPLPPRSPEISGNEVHPEGLLYFEVTVHTSLPISPPPPTLPCPGPSPRCPSASVLFLGKEAFLGLLF